MASLASVLVAGIMASGFVHLMHRFVHRPDFVWVQTLLLGSVMIAPLGAAILIWSRRLPAQLLARGLWWSCLLSSALIACWNHHPHGRHLAGMIAGATALALLAGGREGLEVSNERFQPVAFRGTLTLALVLAMADTGALLWIGLLTLVAVHEVGIILMVPLMVVGVIGLLRLRTWGLLAGMAANILVVTLAATRVLDLGPMRWLFIGTALLQLLVPLPMLVTIVRRRPPPTDRWPRAKSVIATGTIVAIAGLALYAGLIHRSAIIAF